MSEPIFEGWAVLELMGHRRVAGYVREVAFAGAALARVDIPGDGGAPAFTQFYGGSSIYCMTPCSAEAALGVARANRPEPVHSYELPKRLSVAERIDANDEQDVHDPCDEELGGEGG